MATAAQVGDGQKPVVLVVDDSATMRTLLTRMLRALGFVPYTARDGREALATIAEVPIDVVVSDLHMDGVDGLGLLHELRLMGRLDTLPVLVLSGDEDMASVVECIKAGAIDYLSKPVNEHLLVARLASCLARSASDARLRSYVGLLSAERARSVALLRSIVPDAIASRLESGEQQIADRYDDVSVAFIDLVGFTAFSAAHPADHVVATLDGYFRRIDAIARDYGIEKIKTIGDGYMAAAGLPRPQPGHGEALLEFALAVCADANRRLLQGEAASRVRVGLARGPVVAGVIGELRPTWDLWGDTVNLAARLEAKADVNSVMVSETFQALLPAGWTPTAQAHVELKGIGSQAAYAYRPAMRDRRRKSSLSCTGVVDRSMAMREADRDMRRSGMIDLATGILNDAGAAAAIALMQERSPVDMVWIAVQVRACGDQPIDAVMLSTVAQEARALFRADDLVSRVGVTIWALAAPSDGLTPRRAVERLGRRLAARQAQAALPIDQVSLVAGEISTASPALRGLLRDTLPDAGHGVAIGQSGAIVQLTLSAESGQLKPRVDADVHTTWRES